MYLNSILTDFKQKEVKTIKDIKEYDESFKHKQQNYTKPSPRKESLPEWAYSGYTIKDELVDGVCGKINLHTIAAQKYITPQAA